MDSANVVQGLKDSTENTLNAAISRLDVECPPSFVFGVEAKENKGKVMEGDLDPNNKAKVEASNIELARVFVEMLFPIGKDLVIAFRNDKLAAAVKKKWRLSEEEGRVISFPGRSKSAFADEVGAPLQFKAKLKRLGCQCLLVVAPEKNQLRLVADLSDEYQDQMGIILLNSRIHGAGRSASKCPPNLRRKLQADFPPSYHLRFLEGGRKNAVLFRMKGPEGTDEPWILAQQRELIGKVGCASDEVARFDRVEEPTEEEIDEAFKTFDKKDGNLRDKVIGFLEEK